METVTDALGQTERYIYDAKGQLIEKLDKEGSERKDLPQRDSGGICLHGGGTA